MTEQTAVTLNWPYEGARSLDDLGEGASAFTAPGSNICLDFHGDPATAGLVVFSDGNHHMALEESLRAFLHHNPGVRDIFYATTPPAPLVHALEGGALTIGNLTLEARPDVFIGPANILDQLVEKGLLARHAPFMQSRGLALLVRRGNPKQISGAADLLRDDISIAISNPISEKASFTVYQETLRNLTAAGERAALEALLAKGGPRCVFSQTIHHREVPELLAAGRADAAPVYYHLALRYCRIFPDVFDFIALDGAPDSPGPATSITRYHLGLVGDGGEWGAKLADFFGSSEVTDIYQSHGLQRPSDK